MRTMVTGHIVMVSCPCAGIKYDAEKESKAEWDAKQSQLTRIMEQEKNRKMAGRGLTLYLCLM